MCAWKDKLAYDECDLCADEVVTKVSEVLSETFTSNSPEESEAVPDKSAKARHLPPPLAVKAQEEKEDETKAYKAKSEVVETTTEVTSTLNPQPSIIYPLPSTLTYQPSS